MSDSLRAETEEILEAGRARIRAEAEAVDTIAACLDESFVSAAALIRSSPGKVITAGAGTSGPTAARLAHLLSVSGTPALTVHPADALHGTLGAVTEGDVVLVISKGGRSAEINEFARLAAARGAAIIALTGDGSSELAAAATVAAVLPHTAQGDPGGVIAMGSSLAVAAWGDALATVLMQISGYPWEDVLGTHPSGAVGHRQTLPDPLPRLPEPGGAAAAATTSAASASASASTAASTAASTFGGADGAPGVSVPPDDRSDT